MQTQPTHTGRVARWFQTLAEYGSDLHIAYQKGSANVVADGLSRRPGDAEAAAAARQDEVAAAGDPHPITWTVADPPSLQLCSISTVTIDPIFRQQILTGLLADPEANALAQAVRAGTAPDYSMRGGLLYRADGRLFVPASGDLRQRLLGEHHDTLISGHRGRDKTELALKQHYYWPGMTQAVRDYVRSCPSCQQCKSSTQKPYGSAHPLPIPSRPWESVAMDFISGLPKTVRGNDQILTIVDRLTKRTHFVAMPHGGGAPATARAFFETVFRHHGLPTSIVSDRDPQFLSEFWRLLFKELGTTLRMSTAYHPQTDGQSERANRTLEDMLRSFVADEHERWDELLIAVEFAVNSSVQASTGHTPFFLSQGFEPAVPAALLAGGPSRAPRSGGEQAAIGFHAELRDALLLAKTNLADAQQRQAQVRSSGLTDHEFKTGDKVLLSTQHRLLSDMGKRKLRPLRDGPYTIVEMVSRTAARLALPEGMNIHPVISVNRLRPFVDGSQQFPGRQVVAPPPVGHVRGQATWGVERFIRYSRDRKSIRVKWVGYEQTTMEPVDRLRLDLPSHFDELVTRMLAARPSADSADAATPHAAAAFPAPVAAPAHPLRRSARRR